MPFKTIRILKVRRDFTPGEEPGSVNLDRNCGIGCTCSATIFKATPGPGLAERKCLCFNDRLKQGVSEMAGTARQVDAPAGVLAFEVDAELVEHVPC